MSRKMMFAALLALVMAAPAFAQDSGSRGSRNRSGDSSSTNGSNGSSDNNNNRGRGGYDPAQYMNDLKDRMGATDDEWKVIQPKLEKVATLRRENMSMMFGGFRRRSSDSNNSASSADQNKSSVSTAAQELRDVLDKKEATAEEITAKLTAFREARDKSKAAMAAAQKDLKEVLTARQEAVLVSRSMLD